MTVFISREMPADAPFRQLLENAGHEVLGQSLLSLTPLPFGEIPACDWIFFSSGNGVRYFFEGLKQPSWRAHVKWAAIGPATGRKLREYSGHVDFIGNGDPETSARLFSEQADNQTVLFPGARQSEQGIQKRLPGNIRCLSLAVYDNRPVSNPLLRREEVLVFTSPMNAEAYFTQHPVLPGQKIAAIGNSTRKKLQSLGLKEVFLAREATETGMAELILQEWA